MKVYICKVCGHVEFNAAPELCPSCMAKKEEFIQNDNIFKESQEKSKEAEVKHVPAITVVKKCGLIPEEGCTDVHVRIGKTLHPMEEKHFIQFVDCYLDGVFAARARLTPKGLHPAACFHVKSSAGKVTIVENCNLHGYWMAEANL